MAGDTVITVIGNLTGDPELRFTPQGAAVANFTIASTPRNFDRASNEWKEGETLFLRCSIWREAAENVAETLKKGMRVIAQGRLVSRSYETKEGDKRTSMELQVDEIGPSLRFASAAVTRTQRSDGQGYGAQQQGGYNQGGYGGAQQGAGQWGNQQQAPAQGAQQWGGAQQPPAQNQAPAQAQQGQPPLAGNQQPGAQAPAQNAGQADPWGQQANGNYDWGAGAEDEPPF